MNRVISRPGTRSGSGTGIAALAWRNVFRNRRRSALNIIALTVGMTILFLALGWIGGYHRYIYDTLRDFQTGEIQIVTAEWYAERARFPVDTLIGDYEELRSAVLELPAVRSVAPRVVFSARVSTGRESFRIAATAIDPALEGDVGVLDRYIVAGRSPSELARAGEGGGGNEPRGIWIGRPVAEKAGVAVGDTLFLRAMNRHGVENLYDAPIAGIFEYGYPVLDNQMIYLDLTTADELLDLDGGVTHLTLRLHPGAGVKDTIEAIAATIAAGSPAATATGGDAGGSAPAAGPSPVGASDTVPSRTALAAASEQTYYAFERYGGACSIREFEIDDKLMTAGIGGTMNDRTRDPASTAAARAGTLEIRPWQDFARAAVSAVEGDTYSFSVMVAVMYLLIVLGILNSMSMSVHERTREIGTIRAIGIRRRQLLALFAMESVWQAVIAAVFAAIISTPVALWLVYTGVDITSSMPETMPVPFGERFRADFAAWHYLFALASGILTALAGAIIPARRAGRITVAEAMRTVG